MTYAGEVLARSGKRMPSFDKFFGTDPLKKRPKKQSADEIMAALGAIVGPPPEGTKEDSASGKAG